MDAMNPTDASGGGDICDFRPDLGAATPEPSIRDIVRSYFGRHFLDNPRRALDLTNGYCDAIAALASQPTASRGEKTYPYSEPKAWPNWSCPACRCKSFSRIHERKPDGNFGDGPLICCHDCKRTFDTRPASAPPAPTPDAGSDLEPHSGYLFHNPDTGTEWSENHPVESGECDDAEEVRPATLIALREELFSAWEHAAEQRQERDAAIKSQRYWSGEAARAADALAKEKAAPPPAEDLAGQGEPTVVRGELSSEERAALAWLLDAYEEGPCCTPGAVYSEHVTPTRIALTVDLPPTMPLSPEVAATESRVLEGAMQQAVRVLLIQSGYTGLPLPISLIPEHPSDDEASRLIREAAGLVRTRQTPDLAGQGEPVAWAYETRTYQFEWRSVITAKPPEVGRFTEVRNIRPLYAAPAPSRPADREEIAAALFESDYPGNDHCTWAEWLAYVAKHGTSSTLLRDIEACRRRADAVLSLLAIRDAPRDASPNADDRTQDTGQGGGL